MRIIIEGADGTGKTTLAKLFANEYGLDYCHCTASDPTDYEFYKNTARKDNVVWDRHTVGELIYPKIFGRKQNLGTEDARLVLAYAREYDAKIFVLTCDIDVILTRLTKRGGEDQRIIDNIEFIDSKFKFYAKQFGIPIIDTSTMSVNQLFALATEETKPFQFIHK